MSCATCLKVGFTACISEIRLKCGLPANKQWNAYFTDKFGTLYRSSAFTDNEGFLFVNMENFTEGFFNLYSGYLKLEIEDADDPGCMVDLKFTDCNQVETTYKCLELKPIKEVNTNPSYLENEDGSEIMQENGAFIIIQNVN